MENNTTLRVYYSDTDHGGVVYYANYLTWFEIGRTELLRQAGLDYAECEKQGLIAPVVTVTCDYKSPARYNDEITIKTAVEKVGNTSITFKYTITNQNNQEVATGSTVNVFVDMKTEKPTPIPEKLKTALSE